MRKELEKRAAEAIELARGAGAREAWAWASRSRSVSYKVRDGKLEEVVDSTSRSLSVRLYVDGRYSSHHTTDLRPDRLKSFVAEAVAMTRALQPDKFRTLPDPALFDGRPTQDLQLVDGELAAFGRDQRLTWSQEMNSRAAGQKGVISATSGVSDEHGISAGVSSNGFAGSRESTSISIYTEATLDDGEKRPEDWSMAQARHVGDMPPPASIGEDALTRARGRLGTVKGPTRRAMMIVDPRAAGSLIRRLLQGASGSSVQQEKSFWLGKLDKKVVSDKLTVVDNPLIPRGLGSRPFDGEGISAAQMPMVEAGVFRNLYLDTYYANKLGMKPTTGGGSNRVVQPGKRGRDAIVADVADGIFVSSWLGGNMDDTTGDFSFGVLGNLVVKGVIGQPVGEMNVTGNILELFGQLAEVGNDPWPYSSTLAPTLVFDGVQFSGA